MKLTNIYLVYGPKTRLVQVKEVDRRGLISAIIFHREKGEEFKGVIGHPPSGLTEQGAENILAKRKQPAVTVADLVRSIEGVHFISTGEETKVISPVRVILREYDAGRTIDAVIGHHSGKLSLEKAKGIIAERQPVDRLTIERAEQDVKQIKLPDEDIAILAPGEYKGLGGDLDDNPPHIINLPKEVKLFRLSIGFLKHFSENKIANGLLNLSDNASKKEHEVVRCISIVKALELLEVINPALETEMVRLRLPTEAVIDVLLNAREHDKFCAGLPGRLLTASLYSPLGVGIAELQAELSKIEIDRKLDYVVRSASRELKGRQNRYPLSPINHSHLNCAVFEVVDVIQPLVEKPWVEGTADTLLYPGQ